MFKYCKWLVFFSFLMFILGVRLAIAGEDVTRMSKVSMLRKMMQSQTRSSSSVVAGERMEVMQRVGSLSGKERIKCLRVMLNKSIKPQFGEKNAQITSNLQVNNIQSVQGTSVSEKKSRLRRESKFTKMLRLWLLKHPRIENYLPKFNMKEKLQQRERALQESQTPEK